ncbi:MAG: hypothetical protein MJ138_02425 [Kiritimatiellae bacterium]|nr:hypothetical protein [Kiritimatiellia bacterium]
MTTKTALFALVAGLAGFARADANPPWATCTCDAPTPLPAGTSWAGGELSFTNRAANGGASFDFSALDAAAFDGATIRFADGEIAVDSLKFNPSRGFVFVGGAGTVLKGVADKSIFDGHNTQTFQTFQASQTFQTSTWSNLAFTCDAAAGPGWRNGGAIAVEGGSFTIADCAFAGCFAEEFGGAVCALLLTGDSAVENCTFEGGRVSAWNGYGGAIYASAAAEDVRLAVAGSSFVGNAAVNGGAICTMRAADGDELPIALELAGCRFEDNAADCDGGAIFAEGAVALAAAAGDVGGCAFEANVAGLSGGAICMVGVEGVSQPTGIAVGAGTAFRGNLATNDVAGAAFWTAGGAIAVTCAGFSLEVSGRHVAFEGNRAASATESYGGAIYAAAGTSADVSCAAFLGNGSGFSGGAVFSCGDALTISTSIFSNNVVAADGYGGAVSVESGAALTMSNATVRGSNRGAVDVYGASAALVNCLVADNNGETDVFVGGGDGTALVADHAAYGRAEVEEGVPVSTNCCLSGVDATAYGGASLRLADDGYNPVAAQGLVQDALDYDGVPYGSRPLGHSIGAFECATTTTIEIVSTTWYHNRGDGLYYPRLEVRFVGGAGADVAGVTLICGGEEFDLPDSCMAQLRTAAAGDVFWFGVDPETFVQYPGDPDRWGYVPPENRLFGVHDAKRPVSVSLAVKGVLRFAEIASVPRTARSVSAAKLPAAVPVPAAFAEFRIGERLVGKIKPVANAKVVLWGCSELGGEWQKVGEVDVGEDGAFSSTVPEGMRFFRLEAEVAR